MARRKGLRAAACLLAAASVPAPVRAGSPIDNPRQLSRAILACWHAPREGDEITLRLSFRRDGSIFGKPRIVYLKPVRGADGEAELATSVYEALAACRPYAFTPAFGGAVAGRVFLIRFVARRREMRADGTGLRL